MQLFVCFCLLLMFCTADHTQSVSGVMKEMCHITESRFDRVLIRTIDLPVIVTS